MFRRIYNAVRIILGVYVFVAAATTAVAAVCIVDEEITAATMVGVYGSDECCTQ